MDREQKCERDREEHGDKMCGRCSLCVRHYRLEVADLHLEVSRLQRQVSREKADHWHAKRQIAQIAGVVPGATWTEIQAELRSKLAMDREQK